jgi:hypothetical protein
MTANSSLTADTYISPAMQRDERRTRPALPSGFATSSQACPLVLAQAVRCCRGRRGPVDGCNE